MFFRIMRGSFLRRRRRKAIAALALTMGVGVSTAALSVAVDIGDKVSRELRSFGANIVVAPKADTLPIEIGGVDIRTMSEGSFLREDQLPDLKAIFWRHHILGFAPFLYQVASLGDGESTVLVGTWFNRTLALEDGTEFRTGLPLVNDTWKVEGAWPADSAQPQGVAGAALAARSGWSIGDSIKVSLPRPQAPEFDGRRGLPIGATHSITLTGILATGGDEDRQFFVPLEWLQQATGRAGQFRRMQVSALTTPEDAFARKSIASMTQAEYDRWYCTPYVSSIALQLEEVITGSEARPVRRVAQAETAILTRVERLLAVISFAALVGAGLAVLSTLTTTVLERRAEIALLKALGGARALVNAIFATEAALLGLLGGAAGYLAGTFGADMIGRSVFDAAVDPKPVLLPAMLALSCVVALAGMLIPLRTAQRAEPSLVLKERA